MKNLLSLFFLCALCINSLLPDSRAQDGSAEPSPAHVTLTVTKFRAIDSLQAPGYIDATTALMPHGAVTLVDRDGMPTFVVKRAVDLEIKIASDNPSESYRPVAIYFRQKSEGVASLSDPSGSINFATSITSAGAVKLRHKFLGGRGVRYEFFIVVQRASDGAIGIIDPEIEAEISE